MSEERAAFDPARDPEPDDLEVEEPEDEEPGLDALDREGVPERKRFAIEEPEPDDVEPALDELDRQGVRGPTDFVIEEPEDVPEGRRHGL